MFQHKFKNKNIILASASPRRKALFGELKIPFTVQVKNIDEKYNASLKEEEITNFLATLKANAFKNIATNDVVITADTIVWHHNAAIEKPSSKKQAIEILKSLSGTTHKVITSVCIKTSTGQKVFHDTTKVHFKQLQLEEITYYVDTFMPLDKAGAYGIQEWIGYIGVPKIEGSYFNVMGLPVHKLYEELIKL